METREITFSAVCEDFKGFLVADEPFWSTNNLSRQAEIFSTQLSQRLQLRIKVTPEMVKKMTSTFTEELHISLVKDQEILLVDWLPTTLQEISNAAAEKKKSTKKKKKSIASAEANTKEHSTYLNLVDSNTVRPLLDLHKKEETKKFPDLIAESNTIPTEAPNLVGNKDMVSESNTASSGPQPVVLTVEYLATFVQRLQDLENKVNEQQITINAQQITINAQQTTINEQQTTINAQGITINAQQITINAQRLKIAKLESKVDAQRLTIISLEKKAKAQQTTITNLVVENTELKRRVSDLEETLSKTTALYKNEQEESTSLTLRLNEEKKLQEKRSDELTAMYNYTKQSGFTHIEVRSILETLRRNLLTLLKCNEYDISERPYETAKKYQSEMKQLFLDLFKCTLSDKELELLTSSYKEGNKVAHNLPSAERAIWALHDLEVNSLSDSPEITTAEKIFKALYPGVEYKSAFEGNNTNQK